MTDYPYDPDHLSRTAALLYDLIPEFHKRRDRAADAAVPPEPAELRAIVEALAAPLAALRQSIEEMYGDLFVDSAGDAMLPVLARSIALDLAFRDPDANRRDLARAMARRRRKGTPAMLEEMARDLADRQVATREGWKAVMLAQDLNILRAERVVANLRPASVAERAAGPLATLARTVDARPISATSGQVHPRHMVHWAFLSRLYPLSAAACHRLPDGAADQRFAFDAANAWRALPVRSTGAGDRPGTDRVPEGLFAESPGDWHGVDGRFAVRLTGLPAAAGPPDAPVPRTARLVRADLALARLPVTVQLIATDGSRTSGPVEIALMAAPLTGDIPDLGTALQRGGLTVGPDGLAGPALPGAGAMAGPHGLLIRLTPAAPAVSQRLGQTVLALEGGTVAARRASADPALATSGYRRGALTVRLPEMRITTARWLWLAADGSLHDAEDPAALPPVRPLEGGALPARALIAAPTGPVWPEAEETAERTPFAPALAAPGAAPVPVHGLEVLQPGGTALVGGAARSALVFALTWFAGVRQFDPMLRLTWAGPDPRTALWEAVDAQSLPLPANALSLRFQALAARLAEGRADLALAVRFESEVAGALLAPGEVAFTAVDGRAVLIHLPELAASETAEADAAGGSLWRRGPLPLVQHSVAAQVGADGSCWLAGTNRALRRATGSAVPLAAPIQIRRRIPAWRRLCPWQNEGGGNVLDPTPPGRLDIDPRFGLFAMATADGIVGHPAGPVPPPPPVTVDLQTGATREIGAMPVDHDRLLNRAPRQPTRLVSAQGHLGRATDPALLGLPFHLSLAEALAAISAAGAPEEVIRIVDSGFYPAEMLVWPLTPRRLTIEAAAGTRPMIALAGSTPGAASYDRLEIAGIAVLRAGAALLELPPAQEVALDFLTILSADLPLHVRLREAAGAERLTVRRSVLGPLRLDEAGEARVEDSILDAGAETADALTAPLAHLTMDRCSVIGRLRVEQTDVSDSLLTGEVFAQESFRGCIRFSLLAPGGQTPRKHRVVILDAATGARVRPPFLNRDRRDPAYLRLDPDGDARVLIGASDGGEMGAFNRAGLGEVLAGLAQRLAEHTPAGLKTGIVPRH